MSSASKANGNEQCNIRNTI